LSEGGRRVEIDDVDITILREIQEDFRTSYRDMAKKLDLSVGTVHNRIKKLTEMGVIRKFTAVLDPEKLGFELTAIILMKVEGSHILEIEEALGRYRSVIAVYDTTGDFDIVIISKFRTREELNNFIKEILKMQHVKSTVTSIALNVVKEDMKLNI